MEIDNSLKRLRKQQGFSVWGLSVAARVSAATITIIERYSACPSAKTRAKLARALNVSESIIWPHLADSPEVPNAK
jgi:transcriptional regulator with XRE-family HTH domain